MLHTVRTMVLVSEDIYAVKKTQNEQCYFKMNSAIC